MRQCKAGLVLGMMGLLATSASSCRQKSLPEVSGGDSALSADNVATGPTSTIEGEMSDDMRKFRDEFVAMKDQNDVARLIKVVTEKLEKGEYKDNDIRLVAAQILPLKEMRGIVWRLTPLVENRNDTLHSLVLSNLMAVATASRIFLPQGGQQGLNSWKAINRFLAWPYKGIGKQISTMEEFQKFLITNVAPLIGSSIATINSIMIPANKPVVWDNMLIFGRGSFGGDTDAKDRFVTVYEAEKKIILSGLHAMKHNILLFYQYNFDEFPEYTKEFGKLIGLDGFGPFGVNGMSSLDRARVLCGNAYPRGGCAGKYSKLFTKRDVNVMPDAYNHLRESVALVKSAWDEVKARGSNTPSLPDFQLLDPAKLLPWTRITDASINNILAMVENKPVRSAVSGSVVQVNIPAFYKNPPKDLKGFVPVAFDPTERRVTVDGVAKVRNYEYGMSTKWSPDAYRPYFPDVKNGGEVPQVMRDLAQAWGGWFSNTPLATVSMVF